MMSSFKKNEQTVQSTTSWPRLL